MNIIHAVYREIKTCEEEIAFLKRKLEEVQMLSDGRESVFDLMQILEGKLSGLKKAHELVRIYC